MQLSDAPTKLVLAFAASGGKNTIPVASQIGITPGAASFTDGYPPLTRTPLVAGGIPPRGLDENGIFYALSTVIRWLNSGAGFVFDNTFSSDSHVGGYPKGARLLRSDSFGYWLNTTDNNTTDPESAGAAAAGWVPDFTSGISAVTMTNANVTLTALQYGKPIIVISGALVSNLNLIFPNIVGRWIILNNTTGAFTVTCKTAAGSGVVVNTSQLLVGDGTNIYNGNLDAISLLNTVFANAGGTSDALTLTISSTVRSLSQIVGTPIWVRAASTNTTTTPTLAVNGLTAKTIVKGSNTALLAGDIAGVAHWLCVQYDSGLDAFVLANPAKGINVANRVQIQPLTASVAANALTVTYGGGKLDFRNATLATGTVNSEITIASNSITVPSSATLGTISGVQARLVFLEAYNGGSPVLCVVNITGGLQLDETNLISPTLISSGATSSGVIYSAATVSANSPYRIVGFVDISEATAGTWATGPIVVQGIGGQALAALSSLGYGQTWQSPSRSLATTYYNTTGKPIAVHVQASITSAGNAVVLSTSGVNFTGATVGAGFGSTVFVIIPPGNGYSVPAITGGGSILQWNELR